MDLEAVERYLNRVALGVGKSMVLGDPETHYADPPRRRRKAFLTKPIRLDGNKAYWQDRLDKADGTGYASGLPVGTIVKQIELRTRKIRYE